jgi:hypothetical protein
LLCTLNKRAVILGDWSTLGDGLHPKGTPMIREIDEFSKTTRQFLIVHY